jgi:hypothetical protein
MIRAATAIISGDCTKLKGLSAACWPAAEFIALALGM